MHGVAADVCCGVCDFEVCCQEKTSCVIDFCVFI